jgi:hypothetical protein
LQDVREALHRWICGIIVNLGEGEQVMEFEQVGRQTARRWRFF